jgi:hypothetical protein
MLSINNLFESLSFVLFPLSFLITLIKSSSVSSSKLIVYQYGLADPNFDGYFNGKEVPQEILQVDEEEGAEDPYAYCPPDLLPQTEGEVKSAVEDLTQKLRIQGMARRHLFNRSLKEEHPETWKSLRRPASMH